MQCGQAFVSFTDESVNGHVIETVKRQTLGDLRIDCKSPTKTGGSSHAEGVDDALSPNTGDESSGVDDVGMDDRERRGYTVGTRSPLSIDGVVPSQHDRRTPRNTFQRNYNPTARSGPRFRPALQSSQGLRNLEGYSGASATESRQFGQYDASIISSLSNDSSNSTTTAASHMLTPSPAALHAAELGSPQGMISTPTWVPGAYSASASPYHVLRPSSAPPPSMHPPMANMAQLSPPLEQRMMPGGSPGGQQMMTEYVWAPHYGPVTTATWNPSYPLPPQLPLPQQQPQMAYQVQGLAPPYQVHMQHQHLQGQHSLYQFQSAQSPMMISPPTLPRHAQRGSFHSHPSHNSTAPSVHT